jgi:hypothetical protein
MLRKPTVAGQFYSASPAQLTAEVAAHLQSDVPRVQAVAAISPHAGLMYSGHVAGAVYSRLVLPDTVVLVGPNHTGEGPPVSVYPDGAWEIPGGTLSVDRVLAGELLARCAAAEPDVSAHQWEHCLEVQLPFLRYLKPETNILPIVIGTSDRIVCRELGRHLAELVRSSTSRRLLLLASTDMNHYESDAVTRVKDRHALTAIERIDPDGLATAVTAHHISMCGFAPTLAVLHAVRLLGASEASLIRYATSGDVSGDRTRVVGYAGFIISVPTMS